MPERIAAGRRTQIHACSHTWSATAQPRRQWLTVNYQDGRQQDFCDFV